ncbi:host cell division inhibitor Icd-like protein [Escherichia coli]|uniref:host cell division inhibitor Icd-like protein n=1 Tax=Escherichia coli TaxID=562 RepID=UPI001F4229E4|nr:host cell division inhibitor Icd-like protein [Escherichia coli]
MATIPALAHTQNAFIWRFIIVNPTDYRVVHVVASTEREARNCTAFYLHRIMMMKEVNLSRVGLKTLVPPVPTCGKHT